MLHMQELAHQNHAPLGTPPLIHPALRILLDSAAHGIWVVNGQCQVHYANPVARQTTKQARCLRIQSGMLQAVHLPDQAALSLAVDKATLSSRNCHKSAVRSVLRLQVSDTQPPTELLVLITPLHGNESDPILNEYYQKNSITSNNHIGLTAIQLQKNCIIDPATLCLLARSYKLTNTEEAILGLLCDGLDISETAQNLNIAVSTVRSHVRGLFSKMQTNSIRHLMLRVALLPGVAGVQVWG